MEGTASSPPALAQTNFAKQSLIKWELPRKCRKESARLLKIEAQRGFALEKTS